MSFEYYLTCHKHKHKIFIFNDGLCGPIFLCGRELSGFMITHKQCDLKIIDEYDQECEDYLLWPEDGWMELTEYNIDGVDDD